MWNKIKKLFDSGKDGSSARADDSITWFPIWEDPELISKIKQSIYKSNPKSFKTRTSVNLRVIDFSTETEEGVPAKLPLVSVPQLMSMFRPTSPPELLALGQGRSFTPKVVKVENPIAIMGDTLEKYEFQVEAIEGKGHESAVEFREILERLKAGKDDMETSEALLRQLHAGLYEIMRDNPEIARDSTYMAGQGRTPVKVQLLGKQYCLLMSPFGQQEFNDTTHTVRGGHILPIYIPRDGFQMLPFGEMFMGRVLGIAYLNPQPLYKNVGPGIVILASAISIPMPLEHLNR